VTVAQLTRPSLGPEILAKREGECSFCHEPIVAGESYIRKVRDRQWMHGRCASAYDRAIAEHLPEDSE
jgi:hypothetical protein